MMQAWARPNFRSQRQAADVALLSDGNVSALFVLANLTTRDFGIVRHEEMDPLCLGAGKQCHLLIHQLFREAIVPHRHRQMEPRTTRHQIASEECRTRFGVELGQTEAWCVPVGDRKRIWGFKRPISRRKQFQSTAGTQELVHTRQKGRAIAQMRALGARPSDIMHEETRTRKYKFELGVSVPYRKESADVIEVQMRKENEIDLLGPHTNLI